MNHASPPEWNPADLDQLREEQAPKPFQQVEIQIHTPTHEIGGERKDSPIPPSDRGVTIIQLQEQDKEE